MTKVFDSIEYKFTLGSDIKRDGMFMEVSVANTDPLRQLAEVFYSDVTKDFVLTCYEPNIPLEAVESLIKLAYAELPRSAQTENS